MPDPWLKPEWRPPVGRSATIVFVHGAIVRGWEMRLLRNRMKQLGYQVRQFRYRSMMKGLDENVRRLKVFLTETEGDILHVVGHSMGGVLTRLVFERDPDPRPGRLIAVGSPLVNCWVGSRFHGLNRLVGPLLVGRTVTDHISSAGDAVWHGERDFGVLAGIFPIGVGAIFPSHPRPSDGVVLLEETRLKGLRDHAIYRLNHFGMLFSRRCTAEMACFLATGSFLANRAAVADKNGHLKVLTSAGRLDPAPAK